MSRDQPLVSARSSRSMVGHRRGSSGQAMHQPYATSPAPSQNARMVQPNTDSFNFKSLENGYGGGGGGAGTRASAGTDMSSHLNMSSAAHMPGSMGFNRPVNAAPSIAESERLRQDQPLMGTVGTAASSTPQEAPVAQARALYSYTANAEDPNEITFTKGEVMDVLDRTGKWWQCVPTLPSSCSWPRMLTLSAHFSSVRKTDGATGIAPRCALPTSLLRSRLTPRSLSLLQQLSQGPFRGRLDDSLPLISYLFLMCCDCILQSSCLHPVRPNA